MINYIEKGVGLHGAITAAGYSLACRDGAWVADNEPAVQAIIDAYPPSAAAAPLIGEIKTHAREKILARYPEWKQANMTARSVELTEVLAMGGTLTELEQAELATAKAAREWINSVRAASGTHETALGTLAEVGDFAGILAYDWHADWPE